MQKGTPSLLHLHSLVQWKKLNQSRCIEPKEISFNTAFNAKKDVKSFAFEPAVLNGLGIRFKYCINAKSDPKSFEFALFGSMQTLNQSLCIEPKDLSFQLPRIGFQVVQGRVP